MTLKNNKLSIKEINFEIADSITLILFDDRKIIVPLVYYPELLKLSNKQLMNYTIVDDRTIFFKNIDSIFHLEDFIGSEQKWKER
jgi:hypothetical protein